MDLGGPCVGVLLDKSEARQEESLNVFDNKNNRDCAGTVPGPGHKISWAEGGRMSAGEI